MKQTKGWTHDVLTTENAKFIESLRRAACGTEGVANDLDKPMKLFTHPQYVKYSKANCLPSELDRQFLGHRERMIQYYA